MSCSANLTISPMGPITDHIPLAIYLWKAMRQNMLDGAMDILKKASRGVGSYHLADKNSNMVGIESVYDDYTVLYPDNHSLIHANHYETTEFKKNDLAYTYIQDSFGRADRLKEIVMESSGSITVKHIMNFLTDHQNHPDSICNHVDKPKPLEMASESRASIIMVPGKLLIYIAFGPPCENQYWEY